MSMITTSSKIFSSNHESKDCNLVVKVRMALIMLNKLNSLVPKVLAFYICVLLAQKAKRISRGGLIGSLNPHVYVLIDIEEYRNRHFACLFCYTATHYLPIQLFLMCSSVGG